MGFLQLIFALPLIILSFLFALDDVNGAKVSLKPSQQAIKSLFSLKLKIVLVLLVLIFSFKFKIWSRMQHRLQVSITTLNSHLRYESSNNKLPKNFKKEYQATRMSAHDPALLIADISATQIATLKAQIVADLNDDLKVTINKQLDDYVDCTKEIIEQVKQTIKDTWEGYAHLVSHSFNFKGLTPLSCRKFAENQFEQRIKTLEDRLASRAILTRFVRDACTTMPDTPSFSPRNASQCITEYDLEGAVLVWMLAHEEIANKVRAPNQSAGY